jgi:Alpha/beta hydrolase domain
MRAPICGTTEAREVRMKRWASTCCAVCAVLAPSLAWGEVTELVITSRESPTFGGVEFGSSGQYERLSGFAEGALDPSDPLNAGIVNIDKAPRNDAGLVEYRVDVQILKPIDPASGNGWLLYDVVNRGNKRAIARLNGGSGGNDPWLAADAGTGFLMNRGYTVVWSAWQGDITAGDGRVVAEFPVATNGGEPIVGLSREEFIDDSGDNPFTGSLVYPAADLNPDLATLTVRQKEMDERQTPPGLAWEYVSDREISITRPDGDEFDGGAIYEFIYPAKDPIVMGIGFAATRDVISYLRYESGPANPLKLGKDPYLSHAMAFGSSQSGRFLRDLVYQGFNQDEAGRQVLDGLIPHIAGSRKTFTNYEFAAPGRYSRQHEDHLFPGDQFPFSYAESTDPISGRTDGILEETDTCPKVMHIDSETELWQARGSLVVTDTSGADLDLPANVRAYLVTGTQHGPDAVPEFGICQQLSNPLDYAPVLRAVVVALEQWVEDGRRPPPTRYGSVDAGTLVPPDQESTGFPSIPDVRYNGLLNGLRLNDHSVQPPAEGEPYPVLVSKADADGNSVAGLRLPLLQVPSGTHLGWNLRAPGFAEDELCSTTGSYIPFAQDQADREAAGDPRLSLEERYESQGVYLSRVAREAARLVRQRLLLQEDADRILGIAAASDVGTQ